MRFRYFLGALLLAISMQAVASAQPANGEEAALELTPAQLFEFASNARDAGDFKTAETAYRALAGHPDVELRSEARFRLALMLDGQGRNRDAAVLLRQILDEKPDAARVRIELARIQASLGNLRAAERELRAAQASGLPPEVEQLVQFYASAFNSARLYGGSVEVALAPDSNINRATSSDTLGTIIGDFDLDEDAQGTSGLGLAARSQLWGRLPVSSNLLLRGELNGSGSFYRDGQFDDYALGIEAGPELRSGKDRLSLTGVVQWRWFGGEPYTTSYGVQGNWRHPAGRRTQLRLDASVLDSEDLLNELRDATRYSLSAGVDHAFSERFGGGARLTGSRNVARDPGYSSAQGGAAVYLYRELAQTTVVGNFGYSHLEADARLFLYRQRRKDDRLEAGLSATFRGLRVGTLAPITRLRYERNWSTVEIYDYDRIAAEIGVTAAF